MVQLLSRPPPVCLSDRVSPSQRVCEAASGHGSPTHSERLEEPLPCDPSISDIGTREGSRSVHPLRFPSLRSLSSLYVNDEHAQSLHAMMAASGELTRTDLLDEYLSIPDHQSCSGRIFAGSESVRPQMYFVPLSGGSGNARTHVLQMEHDPRHSSAQLEVAGPNERDENKTHHTLPCRTAAQRLGQGAINFGKDRTTSPPDTEMRAEQLSNQSVCNPLNQKGDDLMVRSGVYRKMFVAARMRTERMPQCL